MPDRSPPLPDRPPSPTIVDWDGQDDPTNPLNWTRRQKWVTAIIVSSFTFISPVSSAITAPASDQIARQFGVTNNVLVAMMTSVFILAYALGPLFLGPLSELYGRSRVLRLSNLFYFVWNLACGFAKNPTQLIVCRFLAGIGGSAALFIGGGVLGDCWSLEERGQAVAIYSIGPWLGPVLGPVAGAWIVENSTWPWVFWSTAILDAIIQLFGFIYLQETYPPTLLERKKKKIIASLPPETISVRIRTIYETEDRHWKHLFANALTRPFLMLSQEPILQLIAVYTAFVYGLFYLFLTTMPEIYGDTYSERPGIAGLHYLALGIGLIGTSQLNALYFDSTYSHFKKKNGGVGKPEFRLPSMIPGSILVPIGLLIAGWAPEKKVHWIVADIGMALTGSGMTLIFQGTTTYVVDMYQLHAASALAATGCLRSIAGFSFPLFAPAMYHKLGPGKGNTVLAVIGIVIGCPAPWLLWIFGERIRKARRYTGR